MNRRAFITLLGAEAAWPLAARAQSDRVRRIGVLMAYAEGDPEGQGWVAAFREGLQKLGWTEGRNIWIDTRWTIPAFANIADPSAAASSRASTGPAATPPVSSIWNPR